MKYVKNNQKHKEPWQRGRRGSLCGDIKSAQAKKLLESSEEVGAQRYAVLNGQAYCAQSNGQDIWHGYPVGWVEVPETLRNRWKSEGKVSRREIKTNWN